MSDRRDLYAEIGDKIISKIEETGALPWIRPWDESLCGGSFSPVNPTTGKFYRGINSLVLGMDMRMFETGDPRFCTFKQALDAGWCVKKGEKSTPIVFYKPLEIGGKDDGGAEDEPAARLLHVLRGYNVFHASQIEGIPPYVPPAKEEPRDRFEAPYEIARSMGVTIVERGERAFYSPAGDFVGMPPAVAFKPPQAPRHAFTLLHELGHAAVNARRMNLSVPSTFGSIEYAREEVLIDTASAMSGAALGLSPDIEQHAAYVKDWAKKCRADKKELFRMAAEAQRVSDFLVVDNYLAHRPAGSLALAAMPRPNARADMSPRA